MTLDVSRFAVGDEWVYRARDDAVSERVRVLALWPKKNSVRLDIVFVDDPGERIENVPGARLRVPWSQVEAYDASMANWRRISDGPLDSIEEGCVEEAFRLLIPESVAEISWSPVSGATEIHDRAGLERIIGRPGEEILGEVEWFELNDSVMVSPAGTLLIAEAACRVNPAPVLGLVIEEETEARRRCKHGSERVSGRTGAKESTSPEWEYDWYRLWDRPGHELLRQWCGHRAVTFHERLLAAEAENRRLDVLVTDLVKALSGAGKDMLARYFEEEHERDRIRPETARPVVDRPLHPSELPVREVPVRRRRWA
jgi:hypothetical protein